MRVKKPDKLLRAFGLTLLIMALTATLTSATAILNGGFEIGDFTGWTVTVPHDTSTADVMSVWPQTGDNIVYNAPEGTYFALLKSGLANQRTLLERQVAIPQGGAMGCWTFFDGGASMDPGDDGKIEILDALGAVVATPFNETSMTAIPAPPHPGAGYTEWRAWTFIPVAGGTYTIRASVVDSDDLTPVFLGIDGCVLGDPTPVTMSDFTVQAAGNTKVNVVWQTGTEIRHAGFNVLRATAEGGAYTQVNNGLVAAHGSAVSGALYTFEDRPGPGTFYYKLVAVGTDGSTEAFGPVEVRVGSQLRLPTRQPMPPGDH